MDELEHKLRSALTEMAEEVPPSHHAWAEQERRLAMKSRRHRVRPALMAAVAAAVVALIAVPVMVLNSRTAPVEMGAEQLPSTTGSADVRLPDGREKIAYRADAGEPLTSGPMIVGVQGTSKPTVYMYAYTVQSPKGQMLCFAANAEGNEINGTEQAEHGAPSCAPIARPRSGYSWGMREVPAGNSGDTYVYVMSKPADGFMVRDINGRLIVSEQKAYGDEFTMFAAYMESREQPKAWTVKDAADKVLQNGP
jgi:hypothetical protein